MTPHEPYPRDLIGYASRPPHPRWPNEARIAVSLVLNYEEGGEACVLHGDAHSERSEEHTSELQSLAYLVCRLLLEKKKKTIPLTRKKHTSELQRFVNIVCSMRLAQKNPRRRQHNGRTIV